MKRGLHAAVLVGSTLALLASTADAASIRVRCERQPARSRISVDGKDLAPGSYAALVMSAANEAEAAAQPTTGDEVAFDFDPKNVAAGAVEIAANFVQGQVTGKILDAGGSVVALNTVNCK